MKDVVKEIIPTWSNIHNNDITVSNLAGGITNLVYLLKKNDNKSNVNNNVNNIGMWLDLVVLLLYIVILIKCLYQR
jgi:uncharacterized membrane-anchored protein